MNMELVLYITAWFGIGAATGWFASMMMKTTYPRALLFDIALGSISALVIAFSFQSIWGSAGFNFWSLLVAFLGAVVVLALMRLTTGRQVFSE